jgi:hypothetical protein
VSGADSYTRRRRRRRLVTGNITSLSGKKGSVVFQIGIYGEFPVDKKKG